MRHNLFDNRRILKVMPTQGRKEKPKDENIINLKNELKKICLNCKKPDCKRGTCVEYRRKRDEVLHTGKYIEE